MRFFRQEIIYSGVKYTDQPNIMTTGEVNNTDYYLIIMAPASENCVFIVEMVEAGKMGMFEFASSAPLMTFSVIYQRHKSFYGI